MALWPRKKRTEDGEAPDLPEDLEDTFLDEGHSGPEQAEAAEPTLPPAEESVPEAPVVAGDMGIGATDAPAVHAVDRIIFDALEARASDIHLEDQAEGLRVRYRIDGMLEDIEAPAPALRSAILARLRVMAGLNLAERRVPQDGRMRLRYADRDVDVRMSTVPVLHGESVALRLLDPRAGYIELDQLGMRPNDLGRLMEVAFRPNGMVLTTGPGGSGKSTTLYSLVRRISTGREKIFTVEDPVEYDFEGLCQVSVNYRAGLTFATLLRSLVRQDPDVLLVGEIRDGETADIAVHAGLTGHLVLSTLHTTDAVSALPRMVDLGVAPYLVSHTIEAVMAQRLVRTVCKHCAQEVNFREEDLVALGPRPQEFTSGMKGKGCGECRGTGYLGRTGLYELLIVTDSLREAFLKGKSVRELRDIALGEGMETLRIDGVYKVAAGITTPDEVLRVT